MKSLTHRLLMLLVLSAVTLLTTPSIHASCLYSIVDDDGTYLGFCSCGSSVGPYCMMADGTDMTDIMGPDLLRRGCDIMCPGVPYITKNIMIPSTPLMFKYPKSHQVAQADLNEFKRLKRTGNASPFASYTLNELVLR
jgi:hypothetical protein